MPTTAQIAYFFILFGGISLIVLTIVVSCAIMANDDKDDFEQL